MISNEQEIKEGANIRDIISHYQNIPKGKNKILCPFHNEKTPSFSIDKKRNIATCFGQCQKIFDPVQFVRDKENCSYPEALEILAKIVGIKIKYSSKDNIEIKNKELDHLRSLNHSNQIISNIYFENTFKVVGDTERTINIANRNYTNDTINKFRLSISPNSWTHIVDQIKPLGLNEELLLDIGIIKKNKKGEYYDVFKNRVIFPIRDEKGNYAGLAGRIISEDKNSPKYINSRESKTYQKDHLVYGLFEQQGDIKKKNQAIIVEGYTDVLSLYQNNIKNSVCTGGLSLSYQQIKLIKKYANEVILVYDSDKAGRDALKRNIPKLLEQDGIRIYVVVLPDGEDPDSYIRKHGKDEFLKYSQLNRQEGLSYLIQEKKKECTDIQSKSDLKKYAVDLILKLPSKIEQEEWISTLCNTKYLNCGKRDLKNLIKETTSKVNKLKSTNNLLSYNELDQDEKAHLEQYGFVEKDNKYYFYDKESSHLRSLSNFIIRPYFLVKNKSDPVRLIKIINNKNQIAIIAMPTQVFTNLQQFNTSIESNGNFLFEGKSNHFLTIKKKIYNIMKNAIQIETFGHHKDGFYAFANGIVTPLTFIPIDKNGIVSYKEKSYFLEPLSDINQKINQENTNIENFIYMESSLTIENWANSFYKVHKDKGMIAMSFYFASLFRDVIFRKFNFFPHLFLFGASSTGKTYIARSISAMFGKNIEPFMLMSGTAVGFARKLAQIKNAVAWFDEYRNDIDYRRIQNLKAAYDGAGHQKGVKSQDYKTTTTPVNSACLISGQHQPISDIALFKRCIILSFSKAIRTDNEIIQGDELKEIEGTGQLTSITASIIQKRNKIEEEFSKQFDALKKELRNEIGHFLKIEDRMINNYLIPITVFKILEAEFNLPFTSEQLKTFCIKNLLAQAATINKSDELAIWWDIIEFLHANKDINESDIIVDHLCDTVRVQENGNSRLISFEETKEVVFLNFTRTHQIYLENHRKKTGKTGFNKSTLQQYLKGSPAFIGSVKAKKFDGVVKSCYAFDLSLLNINLEPKEKNPAL